MLLLLNFMMQMYAAIVAGKRIIAANPAISVPKPRIEKGTAANTQAVKVTRTTCDRQWLFSVLIFNLRGSEIALIGSQFDCYASSFTRR